MPLTLTGRLICADPVQLDIVRTHLPEHIHLTRLEPGCEHFEVTQSRDPLVWELHERFATRADFEAHQTRTKASHWGQVSGGIARDYEISEHNRSDKPAQKNGPEISLGAAIVQW